MSSSSDLLAVIAVENLCFDYPHSAAAKSGREGSLFRNLSFSVGAGEMLGIVGPNGSGKSTLLKLLVGILHQKSGAIHLFGRESSTLSRQEISRSIAYVPHEFVTIFPFTVRDVVLMGRYPHRKTGWLDLWGWETREDHHAAGRAMAELNLHELADKSVHEISAGEKQRMLIARTLAQEAKVILLDEPTAFLDLKYQLEICRRLYQLTRERGLTTIVVSHDLNLAAQYCDRLLLLNHGEMIGLAEPSSIIRPGVLETVYQCRVLVDEHPETGRPRVSLPGRIE